MVTVQPHELQPVQRAPHFDSPDQNLFALLHYLRVPRGSGTAFYRHRSTGIERLTDANVDRFVITASAEAAQLPETPGTCTVRTRSTSRSGRSMRSPTGFSSIMAACSTRESSRRE